MSSIEEARRAMEFTEFLQACPAEHEVDLMAGNVATAFHRARSQGWSVADLGSDVAAQYRMGKGTGIVVRRLESMAESPRRARTVGGAAPNRCPRGCYVPHLANQACLCTECGKEVWMVVNGRGAIHGNCQ